MPRHRGPTYQLERVPIELLRQVKARAALEGRPVRAVILAFLEEYAGRIPTREPPPIDVSPVLSPVDPDLGF